MLVSPLVGIAIVHRLPRLPVDWEWAAGGWTCLLCLAVALRWRQWWLWALAALVLGVLWCAFRAQLRMNDLLQPALEGMTVPVRGVVDGLPQRVQGMGGTEGWRFEFRVIPEGASTPSPPRVPPRVLLSCYNMPSPPQVGEQWSLRHQVAPTSGPDESAWRRQRALDAVAKHSRVGQLRQQRPAAGICRYHAGRRRLAAAVP